MFAYGALLFSALRAIRLRLAEAWAALGKLWAALGKLWAEPLFESESH